MVNLKGDRIYVESTGVAFPHKGELFIQGIFRDITERKRAEEGAASKRRGCETVISGKCHYRPNRTNHRLNTGHR